MGYSTEFRGQLSLSRNLTVEEKNYINTFSETRRMKRDVNKLMEKHAGKYGNPFAIDESPESIYGVEGEYFVLDDGDSGQIKCPDIINYNCPSMNQPGLWCQWKITDEDGVDVLEWDGGEKFYEYVSWLEYLIGHFFSKWGVLLNGEIEWRGEEWGDTGIIHVENNVITIL